MEMIGTRKRGDATGISCRAARLEAFVPKRMRTRGSAAAIFAAATILSAYSTASAQQAIDKVQIVRPTHTDDVVHPGPKTQSLAAIVEAMPKNLPRAEGPSLSDAINAARAAQRACAAEKASVSVLVTDVAGKPVVLLSGDGAGYRSQLIAQTKANIVVRFGRDSGDVEQAAKSDPRLAAEARADPNIGMLRAGGFLVRRAGRPIGIVSVSGGSLGGDMHLDERCAKIAVAVLQAR